MQDSAPINLVTESQREVKKLSRLLHKTYILITKNQTLCKSVTANFAISNVILKTGAAARGLNSRCFMVTSVCDFLFNIRGWGADLDPIYFLQT